MSQTAWFQALGWVAVASALAGCGFGGGGSGAGRIVGFGGSQNPNAGGGDTTGSNDTGGTGPVTSSSGTGTTTQGGSGTVTPSISYVTDIRPILAAKCTTCHGPGGSQAMSPLDSYDSLIHGSSQFGYSPSNYVMPREGEVSLLLAKLKGAAGPIMPPAGPLSAAEVQLFADWIAQGALNSLDGVPVELAIVSGNNQTGATNVALAAFVAAVRDSGGRGVRGVNVTFTVAEGTGNLAATTVPTDASGNASVVFTPTAPGSFAVTASVPGLRNSPQTFRGTATSPAAPTISFDGTAANAGDAQTGVAGATLARAFSILVKNPDGSPKSGFAVTFAVTAGGGRLSTTSASTDASGRATSTLTLGPVVGTNTVTASAAGANGSPVTFRATSRAGAANRVTIVSGGGQTGSAGSSLASALVVKVTDANGNPVAASVTFAAATGGGSVSPLTMTANAQGVAQTTARLGGSAGPNTFTATVAALAPATFTETGSAPATRSYVDDIAPLFALRCVSCHGPGGSQQGSALNSYNAVVNGRTRYNYTPAAFVTVNTPAQSLVLSKMKGTSGGGIMPPIGSGFISAAELQLVSEWIEQGARVSAAGPASQIALTSGDAQSAPVGALLAAPFVVTVKDASNRVVANHRVDFFVTGNSGTLSATTVLTDVNGQASTRLTLGMTTGANTVEARAIDASLAPLSGSPVVFTATGNASSYSGFPLSGSTDPLDQAALAALRAAQIEPTTLSTDGEFLRRVTTDLAGRLPTKAETDSFLADSSPTKRADKIDALLAADEFATHWVRDVLGPWTKVPGTFNLTDDVAMLTTMYLYDAPIFTAVKADVPLSEIVRRLVTRDRDEGEAFHSFYTNTADRADVIVGAFAGQSVRCGRCHDHPLTTSSDNPRFVQDDVYGIYAFFANNTNEARKMDRSGARFGNPVQPLFLLDGYGTVAPTISLSATLLSRETVFATQFLASNAFARGTAHRIWSEVAAPLLNPDDFLAANLALVQSPAFLDALTATFRSEGTSLKGFLRKVMGSKVYQLSSAGPNTLGDKVLARYPLRRHHSEVLENGVHQVAGLALPSAFNGTFKANYGYPDRFSFGNTNRADVISLSQALVQLNSTISTQGKVTNGGSDLGTLATQVDTSVITFTDAVTALFRRALSRDPSTAELNAVLAAVPTGLDTTRRRLEDVAVALGASVEFVMR